MWTLALCEPLPQTQLASVGPTMATKRPRATHWASHANPSQAIPHGILSDAQRPGITGNNNEGSWELVTIADLTVLAHLLPGPAQLVVPGLV